MDLLRAHESSYRKCLKLGTLAIVAWILVGCAQTSAPTIAIPTPTQAPTSTPTSETAPTLSTDEAFEALRGFIAENQDDRFYREVRNFASFDRGTWFPGVRAWVYVGLFPDDIDDPGFRGLTIIFRVFEDTLAVERLA